jgi:hypothetical protein
MLAKHKLSVLTNGLSGPVVWVIVTSVFLTVTLQYVATIARSNPELDHQLVIREFLAANGTGLTDEDGDYSDWIELHNPGNTTINLGGWALTDDADQLQKWPFPDTSLGGGKYLVIFASGKDRRDPAWPLHTNFKLNADGEFLALYNILDDQLADNISPAYPPQLSNVSYGRVDPGFAYRYMANPTPGEFNNKVPAWEDQVSEVSFSKKRGIYDRHLAVELSSSTPGAVIRYTTDGSEPAVDHGFSYSSPIPVTTTTLLRAAAYKPGFLPSPIGTHSYIFSKDVLNQPVDPAGFPATWGAYTKEYEDSPEYKVGSPVVADYEMDPEIINQPDYAVMLPEALTSLPSLSIVTDMEHFSDLYSNPLQRGPAWERPVSVELLYPDDQLRDFQIDAGLRVQGGVGRREYIPKHSFRLFFRAKYGASKLSFPLFPDSPVDSFDTLVLRGGVNRSYAGKAPQPDVEQFLRQSAYIRDEWLRSSQRAISGVSADGIFVHLYLNGLYWGLYNVVERPDASFTSAYLGGRKEDWYAVNHSGPISGVGDRFEALKDLIGDESEPVDREAYAQIQQYLDITQFIDFLILNFYAGNDDWADNNWYAGVRNPDGKIRYFVWDGEKTWEDGAKIVLGRDYRWGQRNLLRPLVSSLILNPEFKMTFFDRLYKHLFNDGALTDANSQSRWLEISQRIEKAIVAESGRWGDARYEAPIRPEDWLQARDNVLAQMDGQAERVIAIARAAGYPEFEPPSFSVGGGQAHTELRLSMAIVSPTAQDGTIFYTTDNSDPRERYTAAVSAAAKADETPLEITRQTHLKARILVGDTWSALNEATLGPEVESDQLRITEIMYNPVSGSDYEFIELKNCGDTSVDLSNNRFKGIDYTFPPGTGLLGPNRLIVLASNAQAFAERYPGIAVAGIYDKRLSNSGETVALQNAAGRVISSVAYDDEQGWPISPDGRGDSLVLVEPEGDPNDPKSWRASPLPFGSPGSDDHNKCARN